MAEFPEIPPDEALLDDKVFDERELEDIETTLKDLEKEIDVGDLDLGDKSIEFKNTVLNEIQQGKFTESIQSSVQTSIDDVKTDIQFKDVDGVIKDSPFSREVRYQLREGLLEDGGKQLTKDVTSKLVVDNPSNTSGIFSEDQISKATDEAIKNKLEGTPHDPGFNSDLKNYYEQKLTGDLADDPTAQNAKTSINNTVNNLLDGKTKVTDLQAEAEAQEPSLKDKFTDKMKQTFGSLLKFSLAVVIVGGILNLPVGQKALKGLAKTTGTIFGPIIKPAAAVFKVALAVVAGIIGLWLISIILGVFRKKKRE